MSVLILEFDLNVHLWSKWEAESLIYILRSDRVNIRDKDVKHDDLIAEGLLLLYDYSDLSIFVESPYALLVDQWYNRGLDVFKLVGVCWIVKHTLLAVSQAETGSSVCLYLGVGVGRHQVQVGLLFGVVDELRNVDLQLILYLHWGCSREPIFIVLIERGIFNRKLKSNYSLPLFATCCVNGGTIDWSEEDCIVVVCIIVSDVFVAHS